jgi:hypothetical protein
MSKSILKISILLLFTVSFSAFAVFKSEARPKYMSRYNADKNAKREYKNKCTICHIGRGGGENTYFGEDFADSGYRFTPELKAKYPKYFKK